MEDTQYLNRSWTQSKSLKSLKNTVITSVGWDLANNDALNTGLILCGTSSGQIYEMSIEAASASTMLRSLERGWKLLYTFPDADILKTAAGPNGLVPAGPCVLDGLGWFKVPSGTKSTTHCVFVTSAARIWQFIGGSNFEQLFASYTPMPPYGVYHTLPNEGAGTKNVELHFYHKYLEQQTLWPKALAWFLGPHIPASSTSNASSSGANAGGRDGGNAQIPHGSFHEGAWMANFSFSDLASNRMHDLQGASGALGAATGSASSGVGGSSSGGSHSFDPHTLNVIDSFKHVPFGEWKPADATSVSMVLTEFHIIVLYHNGWVQFVSRLTNELVFECKCNIGRSQMRGLAHDPKTNITFAYTDFQLFEVHIENEAKNVWRQYLRNGQYDLAEQYAKEDWQRDAIWTAAANHYFSQKLYKIAAEIYAKTSRSFEEVTLKFMNEASPSYGHQLPSSAAGPPNFGGPSSNAGSTVNAATTPALMVYLKEKLKIGHFQSEMQPTVLCTWLTELYLAKLNDLEAQQSLLSGTSYSSSTQKGGPSLQALKDAFESLQDEFKSFLHQYESTLNRPTIMGLITSYGRVEEMLEYARVVKAYDVVVAWLLQSQDWDRALTELRTRRLSTLLYKHAALLLQNAPAPTVQVLIDMCRNNDIEARDLLPALMRYQSLRQESRPKLSYLTGKPLTSNNATAKNGDKSEKTGFLVDGQNHAIRFLEFVIHHQGNKDSAVHNLLIAMYAEEDAGDEEDRLLKFVESPVACIDLEYALGLCEKHKHVKAQVAIYSKMGLYEEAVALALKGNFVDLAKSTAEAVENEELKKRLWLDLASYMIQKDSSLPQNLQSANVAKVMQFIQQSGILKIEDVLPVFPPFVVINDFKDEICRSLKEYNSHINDLVMEIEDSTNAAQAIRADIDKLPNKFGAISSNQTCDTCRTPILSKSFYLFPCSHVFHQNCLIDYLKPLLVNPQQRQSLVTLSDALMQKRIQLAQRAAMERDRDSAFASAAPTSTTSSFSASSLLPSFFDSNRDGSSSGPGGAISSLLSGTPLSGLNLPFGRDSPSVSGNPHSSSLPPGSGHLPHSGGDARSSLPASSSPNPFGNNDEEDSHASQHDSQHHHHGAVPGGHKHGAPLPPASVLATWSEKQLQDEIDRFIASECPLCGDIMIESVPRPLLDKSSAWDLSSNRL